MIDFLVCYDIVESCNVLVMLLGMMYFDEVVMFGVYWDVYGIGVFDV